jgi:hypothetical protein
MYRLRTLMLLVLVSASGCTAGRRDLSAPNPNPMPPTYFPS